MHRKYTIFFDTDSNVVLPISYFIENNNSIAEKWWELTVHSINSKMKINSVTTNTSYKSLPKLLKRINSKVENINSVYDKNLPLIQDVTKVNNEILNYLHEEFEVYGDRMDQIKKNISLFDADKLHSNFLNLNEIIHMIETAVHSGSDGFPNFSSLVDFLPAGIFQQHYNRLFRCIPHFFEIKKEDMLFLEDRFAWGGLYCGYNTLGKDYLTVYPENDYEVIERDEIRTQSRFSTETWLNFGPDMTSNNSNGFYKWYLSLSLDLRKKIPIGDLNKLQLGRFRLGYVDFNDTFLDFEPDIKEWVIPGGHGLLSSTIKQRWNDEIFSTVTNVVGVECRENGKIVASIRD